VRELAEHHVFTVNDAEIAAGMRFGFERMKLVVEPAAGCGIATVVEGHLRRYLDAEEEEEEGRRVRSIGVILCGGNVDLDALPW
jgi:serine racemase